LIEELEDDIPQTPNPKPQTPNPKPQTPNPKPQTPKTQPKFSDLNPRKYKTASAPIAQTIIKCLRNW
jgi:hypothetical protein